MGVDFYNSFIPNFIKIGLSTITVRADAVYFDVTGLRAKGLQNTIRFLDIFIQKLQPTTLIFIAEEGVAPFQKNIKKDKPIKLASKVDLQNDPTDYENNLINEIQKKIEEDDAWNRPTVIYSSHKTPGEAEHKIFTCINTMKGLHKIGAKKSDNFINFIISQDADCMELAMANRCHNTFVVNIESEDVMKTLTPGKQLKRKWENDEDCYTVVSIELLKEYVYMYMTGKREKPTNIELAKVCNDFILLCLFRENDFVYKNGFNYQMAELYKDFYEQKRFLSDKDKINNKNLSDFIKYVTSWKKKKYSPDDIEKQVSLIFWCFKYYHKTTADYVFCATRAKVDKEGITISDFLKSNPDFNPDFNGCLPTFFERQLFHEKSCVAISPKIAEYLKTQKINDDYSNIGDIIDDVRKILKEDEEEYLKNKPSIPYIIHSGSVESSNESGLFKIKNKKERKHFIDSFWSFQDSIDLSLDPVSINITSTRNLDIKHAKRIIGKDVCAYWPNVRLAKVCKVFVDNCIIDEDKNISYVNEDYIKEDIEMDIENKYQINVKKEKNVYLYVKPRICISNSRKTYIDRPFYKIIPIDLAIPIEEDHPIYENYEPFEDEKNPEEGDLVYVIPEKAIGQIEAIKKGKYYVKYMHIINTHQPKKAKITGSISIDQALKELRLDNVDQFRYYFEKSGFALSLLDENYERVPKCILSLLKTLIMKESFANVTTFEYEPGSTLDEEETPSKGEFKKRELIWKGIGKIPHNPAPVAGSRVLYIGKSNVRFGCVGTVTKCSDINQSISVTFDFPVGIEVSTHIGDLFVI